MKNQNKHVKNKSMFSVQKLMQISLLLLAFNQTQASETAIQFSSLQSSMQRGANFISRGGNDGYIEHGPKVDAYDQVVYETIIAQTQRHMKPENIGVMVDYPTGELKIGQIAYTRSGTKGVYSAVFMNGDIALKSDKGISVMKVSDSAYINCLNNVCASQLVYVRGGKRGEIISAFPSGEYVVAVQGTNRIVSRKDFSTGSELLKLEDGRKTLAIGETVYTLGGSKASLVGVIDDNTILLMINGFVHDFERQELGLSECLSEICLEDKVVTVSKSKGVVKALYSHYGKAALEVSGQIVIKNLSELKKLK